MNKKGIAFDEFMELLRKSTAAFEESWRKGAKESPGDYVMHMHEVDWWEQFEIFLADDDAWNGN